jgi:hypothetical protein
MWQYVHEQEVQGQATAAAAVQSAAAAAGELAEQVSAAHGSQCCTHLAQLLRIWPHSSHPSVCREPVLVAEQVCHPALLMFCAAALRQSPAAAKRNVLIKRRTTLPKT